MQSSHTTLAAARQPSLRLNTDEEGERGRSNKHTDRGRGEILNAVSLGSVTVAYESRAALYMPECQGRLIRYASASLQLIQMASFSSDYHVSLSNSTVPEPHPQARDPASRFQGSRFHSNVSTQPDNKRLRPASVQRLFQPHWGNYFRSKQLSSVSAMNLNDFVVVPNKPKSVKLNVRNLRELRMETVQLDQENKHMENRLKELREIMSHEKEEREKSGAFRWKSAQANSGTRSKEKGVKLSAGKMKIRVLKDESLPEAQRPEKVPEPPPRDPGHSRKPRLKGKVCGQCEARTAGLVCAECGEDYCVGCFARFHQKGALKHHRMIPVQAELQTSVSSLDVLSRFQKQIGEEKETSSQSTQSTAVSPATLRTHEAQTPAGYQDTQTYSTQVLFVNEGEEVEDEEDKGSLLSGCFDEEASSRFFQQAVSEWRERKQAGDTADEREPHQPNRRAPVTVEVIGTQAGEMILQPIHIEFREHSLSYMEKLLLKKHRRTPIESYCPFPAPSSPQDLLMGSPTQLAEALTAEEMDLHKYCASLFAVSSPAGGERPDKTSKSCLSITEIDEMVGSPPAFSSSGVQRGDDKQKLNQGSEDSFTTSEEKPPSDQLSPLVRSQKLQIPRSEDLKLKLSVDQQVERKLQRTQSPRLGDSPKPQMARSSAPLTPKFTFTTAARSSSPVPSKSSWRQESPSLEDHSLALSDCFHPSSNSTRPTDLHRSPPPPSSPLSPSLSLSDSDSLSDSVGLIPADEDSSDEEMRGCADREQEEEEEEEKSATSLHPTLSPAGVQETPHSGLFTEPSQALISLAQRKASESQHYQGLEGFLTLGLDLSSVQPSPAPPHTPTERRSHSQELMTVGQGSWRPASSLRHYAEEELVFAVINNQPISNSSRSATPTGSATLLRRPNLPGSSRGITPTFSRPNTADPAGTPEFQPLSRAAVEILEVQSVERPELTDSEDEANEDDQALAGLEEELRWMSRVNPNRRT
ncbi:hypothetical protein MHYP_G00120280 [Metynnis hypsauchen]